MKKIVVKVTIACQKCKTLILTTVAELEGIKSLNIDVENGILTVVGDVDPVCIVTALRKKKRGAVIDSVGPEDVKKPVPEKKDNPCKDILECCSKCSRGSSGATIIFYDEPQYGCIIS